MLNSISMGTLGMAICSAISVVGLSAVLVKFAIIENKRIKEPKVDKSEDDYDL